EEVGDVVFVEWAFDAGLADEGDEGGDVGGVHVAEAGGGVGDSIVAVAEFVDREPLVDGDVGARSRLDGEDEGVVVAEGAVFDVGAQWEGGGGLAAVQEDGGAGNALERWVHGVELVDEGAERALVVFAPGGDELSASLPGGENGEGDERDQQGEPGAVGEF